LPPNPVDKRLQFSFPIYFLKVLFILYNLPFITQKELAERVGRDRTYINRIEKGETDLQLSSFIRLADALGIMLRLDVNLA